MKKILYLLIVMGSSLLPLQAFAECSSTPAGYSLLGELNDHRYYLSEANFNHDQASAQAAALGGYMASIVEGLENEFLRSRINKIVRIGLSDSETEGFLQWDSGEAFRLNETRATNSDENDFANMNFWNGSWELEGKFVARPYILEVECDSGPSLPADLVIRNVDLPSQLASGGALPLKFEIQNIGETAVTNDYTVDARLSLDGIVSGDDALLLQRNIQTDLGENQNLLINETISLPNSLDPGNYIVIIRVDSTTNIPEISESNNQTNRLLDIVSDGGPTGECPNSLSGYTSMGTLNDHAYFLADERENWNNASNLAGQVDGYLASIGSQAENEFLKNNINEISLIGLNDAGSEGALQWDSGESVGYQNVTGSNSDNGDYANMNFWNGGWDFDNAQVARRYIVEIECGNTSGGDKPDLNLSNLSALASGSAGSVVSFTFDLNNSGLAIASESYRIEMFLTDDGTVENGDPLVGEIPTGNTPLGTISAVTGAITIPSNTAPGNYILVIVADSDEVVDESNENNNQISASLSVTSGAQQCAFSLDLGQDPAIAPLTSFFSNPVETAAAFDLTLTTPLTFDSRETTQYNILKNGSNFAASPSQTVPIDNIVRTPNGDVLEVSGLLSDSQSVRFTRTRSDGSQVFNTVVPVTHNGQTISGVEIFQVDSGFMLYGRPISSGPPNSSPFFIKTNSNGNQQWQVNMGADDFCRSHDVVEESASGGFLIIEDNFCNRTADIIRVSTNGQKLWQEDITGDLVSNRIGPALFSPDGQFVYQSNYIDPRARITKRNAATGEIIWRVFSSQILFPLADFTRDDRSLPIVTTRDGGVIMGYGVSTPGNAAEGDAFQIGKLDGNGELVWSRRFDDLTLAPQLETEDGSLLFAGIDSDRNQLVVRKFTADGTDAPNCTNSQLNQPEFAGSFGAIGAISAGATRGFNIDIITESNTIFTTLSVPVIYLLSTDTTPDSLDIRMASSTTGATFSTLSSDGFIGTFQNRSLVYPTTTPTGQYHILAVLDPFNSTDEDDENNNVIVSDTRFSVNAPSQNIDIASSFRLITPKSAASSTTTTFFDVNMNTVPNGGTTSFSYEIAFYLSTDENYDSADIPFVDPNINSEFQDATSPFDDNPVQQFYRLVVPQGTPAGNYFLITRLDPNNQVTESNENNNVFASAQSYSFGNVTSSGTIDLELEVTVDDSNLEKFKNYTFTMSLSNNGAETATNIEVSFENLAGKLAFVDASATKGDHQGWNFSWRDFDLAPGETATATITYFTLIDDAPITLSAEVDVHTEEDIDSTPGNSFTTNEDDNDSATLSP